MESGIDAFIRAVEKQATLASEQHTGANAFILKIGDDFAFIRLSDLHHPFKFLKQLAGAPPVQFGTKGFRSDIVDDKNPARHYTAFVFVGYWLPYALGWLVLWGWEILGYFRYRFQWSPNDIRCGMIGLRHGRAVRREGAQVLADYIRRDLKSS
ncbi:MAG: hypothetical protein U0175_09050 [Caldilineaceae bacterium]